MSILQHSAPFSLEGLDFVRVALVPADAIPTFTTSAEYADWGYERGLELLDLGPAHLLPHSFWSAAVRGYKAGREDAARAGREGLAWTLGRLAGVHGHKPRLPRSYTPGEASAYGEGWAAGDAERQDFLRGVHGGDHDQQPDPYDVEANTIGEGEWHEMSEGFVRYPEEEAVEVFGAKAYTDRM